MQLDKRSHVGLFPCALHIHHLFGNKLVSLAVSFLVNRFHFVNILLVDTHESENVFSGLMHDHTTNEVRSAACASTYKEREPVKYSLLSKPVMWLWCSSRRHAWRHAGKHSFTSLTLFQLVERLSFPLSNTRSLMFHGGIYSRIHQVTPNMGDYIVRNCCCYYVTLKTPQRRPPLIRQLNFPTTY